MNQVASVNRLIETAGDSSAISGRGTQIRFALRAASVLCQISRSVLVALTWAGLMEWQTIKVPVVAQVGPTAAFQRAHCHLIRPDRCLPGATLRSGACVVGPAGADCHDGRTGH